jgi:N utilization substance protein A
MLDTKVFLNAIDALETNNGIAREVTIEALKEAFASIFKKKGYEDTVVEVNIIPEIGEISIYTVKKVVEAVEDDALEIDLEDAREVYPDIQIGDEFKEKQDIEEFTKADALKFKSILKQKIKEAEKAATYATYAEKQGELINGVVEKVEPKYTIINIGRTSVTLSDSHKIGDEKFEMGQTIKVYLAEVNADTKGPVIKVSRSDPGFLKRLFEEEIPEIFDGTVVIKGVARKAGERAKVSVSSNDSNVDPIGACIGQAGTKIQKICQQLGKEKIDIVQYHEYPGAFIAEALKPAEVLGVKLDEENHSAIAVVKNDDLRVAIGKRGINAVLAVELTKWKIDIKELDDALAEGIDYETVDVMKAKDTSLVLAKKRDELIKARAAQQEAIASETSVEETPVEEVTEEVAPVNETVETPVEETVETPVEEVKEEAPVEEVKVEYNPVKLNKDFSLSDLEKELESEKKKPQQTNRKKFVKKDKEEEKEETPVVKTEPKNYMPIYTEEEEEEFEDDDDEVSKYDDDRFDEYDSDEYYEDN